MVLNDRFLRRLITASISICLLLQLTILPSGAGTAFNDNPDNSLQNPGQSSVSPRQAADQIDKLTKQILLKEIELQRFSILYTLEVAKQGRWKGWRYAFFQEANGATGLAGGIISTHNRGSNLHTPTKVKLYPQEAANYIPMIGCIIGASAAALEFSINGYHDLTASVHGYSPAKAIKHVSEIKHEIDSLMDQRQRLIQIESTDSSLSARLSVDNAEGKVLQDMLDQSLQEFSRYHVNARKLLTFQQLQYLFDIAKYTTNAIGCDFAFKSLDQHKRLWNGKAGVFFVISGQLTMVAPVLSRLAAKGVGKYTKYRLRDVLHDSEDAQIAILQNDLQALEKLRAKEPVSEQFLASLADRQAIFESHEKNFSKGIIAQEKKNDAAKLSATQNILAGAFVGGSKTASGVLFLIPGFFPKYNRNDLRSSRVTNDLLFTSAVVGLPATSFSMLDTLRIQVKGELNRAKAAKAGALPGQIAANRLQELEQIEKRLKAM